MSTATPSSSSGDRGSANTITELREEIASLRNEVAATHKLIVNVFGANDISYRKAELVREITEKTGESPKYVPHAPPSIEMAKSQCTHMCELSPVALAYLAAQGNHAAHRERLLREIMSVDNVTWEEAHDVLFAMDMYKERHYWRITLPYRVGILSAFTGAISSAVLVFCKPVASWYALAIVGEELPEGVAEMTISQVGTWTWAWMEPMIGTASFVILCGQFLRAQLIKLNMKPFLEYMESIKADRLAKQYPHYDRSIVRAWAKPLPKATPGFFPIYERSTGLKGPDSGL